MAGGRRSAHGARPAKADAQPDRYAPSFIHPIQTLPGAQLMTSQPQPSYSPPSS